MNNFYFCTPTKVYFGKGQIEVLPSVVSSYGKKVLLVYGGGSIKKTGLYDKVKELLKDCTIYELNGVEPNPKYESVLDGVKICKEKGIEVVLAVGGGSVIDCSKAICAGAKYDGETWDLISYKAKVDSKIPLVTILTLSATGSEFDYGAVISRMDTNEKVGYCDDVLKPEASITDPEYTFTVPANQTAAGSVDIISHVLEQYFTDKSSFIADCMCESVLKTVIKYAPIAIKNPNDYEARANLMWASSLGCNGILSLGNNGYPWSCHQMEHVLSAYYDITHGVGLAIVTPRWMEYILSEKTLPVFVKYGKNVWGIDGLSDQETARLAIKKTYDYFLSLGIPMTLKEVGIDEEKLEEMAKRASDSGLLGAYVPLNPQAVFEIYKACL